MKVVLLNPAASMTEASKPDAFAAPRANLSRRELLACLSCGVAGIALSACAEGGPDILNPDPDSYSLDGRDVIIVLDRIPGFAGETGSVVIGSQQLIVLKRGAADYRAFNNRCTHARCPVQTVRGSRMVCGCHGSEYNDEGTNVVGPAPSPLSRHMVALDTVAGTLRVIRNAVA